ncbi:MAG: LPS assembly lipoprotein LptE [Deltaproteobacteria bacterium]|nr:LPS assembly lipoprotein LptE [Deltaproteobacteria bacterium]
MTDAVRREFLLHRFAEVVSVQDADAVMVGVLKKFTTSAISFSRSDFATEYRATLWAQVRVVTKDGTVLWSDRHLTEFAEYRQTPNIFESEANKKAAVQKLAEIMARDVHARLFRRICGMTPDELRKLLAKSVAPGYIVIGTDYLVRRSVAMIREVALGGAPSDFNVDSFRAGQDDLAALRRIVRTLPMMGRRRVVLISEIEKPTRTI